MVNCAIVYELDTVTDMTPGRAQEAAASVETLVDSQFSVTDPAVIVTAIV
jgi:hypothetical protein